MAVFFLLAGSLLADQTRMHVLMYAGQFSPLKYHQVPFGVDWELKEQYMVAAGVGSELARFRELGPFRIDLGLEAEGIAAQHWGAYGRNYQEYAGGLVLRWHLFPWSHVVPTSVAHGFGLSYATRVPEQEVQYRRGRSERLLGYLMWDVALSPPGHPELSAFFRIHHRSGAAGTFGGVYGASNYPCVGLRYNF